MPKAGMRPTLNDAAGGRGLRRNNLDYPAGVPVTLPDGSTYFRIEDGGMGPVVKPTGTPVQTATGGHPPIINATGGLPATSTVGGPTLGTLGQSALQNFSDSAGMKFLEDNGNRMINNNMAAKGMLQSGATLQGLTDYANSLHSEYLNKYMSDMLDWSKLGLGAAGILAGAGNYSAGNSMGTGLQDSSGSSSSKQGIFNSKGFQNAMAAGAGGG